MDWRERFGDGGGSLVGYTVGESSLGVVGLNGRSEADRLVCLEAAVRGPSRCSLLLRVSQRKCFLSLGCEPSWEWAGLCER